MMNSHYSSELSELKELLEKLDATDPIVKSIKLLVEYIFWQDKGLNDQNNRIYHLEDLVHTINSKETKQQKLLTETKKSVDAMKKEAENQKRRSRNQI